MAAIFDIKFIRIDIVYGEVCAVFSGINDDSRIINFYEDGILQRINLLDKLGVCADEELKGLRELKERANFVVKPNKGQKIANLIRIKNEIIALRKLNIRTSAIAENIGVSSNRVLEIMTMFGNRQTKSKNGRCEWLISYEEGGFETLCNNIYHFYDDRVTIPKRFKYCPYCSLRIKKSKCFSMDSAPVDGTIIVVHDPKVVGDYLDDDWVDAYYDSKISKFVVSEEYLDASDDLKYMFILNPDGWRPCQI